MINRIRETDIAVLKDDRQTGQQNNGQRTNRPTVMATTADGLIEWDGRGFIGSTCKGIEKNKKQKTQRACDNGISLRAHIG